MKAQIKRLFILMIFFGIIIILNSNTVFASATIGKDGVNKFTTALSTVDTSRTTTIGATSNFIGSIIYVFSIIGSGIATIMLIVLAIKYIGSAPNEKAEIKKHLVMYVLGVVILYASSGLLNILRMFVLGNFK